MILSIIRFLTCINNIFHRKDRLSKVRLLFDFFRINFKFYLAKIFGLNIRSDTVLGHPIAFPDYDAFRFLFQEIFIHGSYAFHADKSPRIVDCGGSFGMATLYFKLLYPQSEIIVFEPGDKSFTHLTENVKQNKLKKVTCVNAALAAKDGTVRFDVTEHDLAGKVVKKGGVAVPAVRLSPHLKKKIDFLKLDIEGSEGAVLPEIQGNLGNVQEIIMEYHGASSKSIGELSTILERAGFTIAPLNAIDGEGKHSSFLVHATRA